MDIVAAYTEISSVVDGFQSIAENISTHHDRWFRESNAMMLALDGKTASVPRTSGRSIFGESNPVAAVSPLDFYRIQVSIPIVGHFLSELTTRFGPQQLRVALASQVIPSFLWTNVTNDSLLPLDPHALSADQSEKWIEQVMTSAQLYTTRGPPPCLQARDIDPAALNAELRIWCMKWVRIVHEKKSPSLPCPTLCKAHSYLHANLTIFPSISKLLRILATLPVTSCTCERTFSALRQLKTYLRATMADDRLTFLALIHIYYDFKVDFEKLLDDFIGDSRDRQDRFRI